MTARLAKRSEAQMQAMRFPKACQAPRSRTGHQANRRLQAPYRYHGGRAEEVTGPRSEAGKPNDHGGERLKCV